MIPWNGDGENLIDRFDGRALLDMYIDPDPRAKRQEERRRARARGGVCGCSPVHAAVLLHPCAVMHDFP